MLFKRRYYSFFNIHSSFLLHIFIVVHFDDVKPYAGKATSGMEGLLTPRDLELTTRWNLAIKSSLSVNATSGKPTSRVRWIDTEQMNALGLRQQTRQDQTTSLLTIATNWN
jgi:hypothetical protein